MSISWVISHCVPTQLLITGTKEGHQLIQRESRDCKAELRLKRDRGTVKKHSCELGALGIRATLKQPFSSREHRGQALQTHIFIQAFAQLMEPVPEPKRK